MKEPANRDLLNAVTKYAVFHDHGLVCDANQTASGS
jgi:hypothetical protein